jgi:hypothetical protein
MGEEFMAANNTILGGSLVAPTTPLTPEKIVSRELGYTGEFRSLGLTVDGRAYVEQVSDMITYDKFVGAAPTYGDSLKNLLDAEYRGVETTVKYRWDENHSWLSANYVYQQASVSLGSYPTLYFSTLADPTGRFSSAGALIQYWYQSQIVGAFSQEVPKNSASLLLSQRLSKSWQFSAGYYWRDQVRVGNVSPATLISSPVTPETVMHRLDLRLGKSFKYDGNHTAEIAVVVQNATQDGYTNYGTVDASANVLYTRRSWLTATFNF